MKALRLIALTGCIFLVLTQCGKNINQPSRPARISTPALIFGKWNLVDEKDTIFYSEHLKASSWNFKNWFYNFDESGILEISNRDIVDSFTYYFSDEECVNIAWTGWPNDTYTDTILKLTETDYVFKHWKNNQDNSKTKKVFYLSK